LGDWGEGCVFIDSGVRAYDVRKPLVLKLDLGWVVCMFGSLGRESVLESRFDFGEAAGGGGCSVNRWM